MLGLRMRAARTHVLPAFALIFVGVLAWLPACSDPAGGANPADAAQTSPGASPSASRDDTAAGDAAEASVTPSAMARDPEPTAPLDGLVVPDVDLDAPHLSYRKSLPGVQLCRPALDIWFDGRPRLIASDRWGITVYDERLDILRKWKLPYRAVDLAMLPRPEGGRQLVLLGTTQDADDWADRVVSLDANGAELWSHAIPLHQLTLRSRLTPLHGEDALRGVAVQREGPGLIAFDLAGEALWEQRALGHSEPDTHPSVPGWLCVPGGGAELYDHDGVLRHEVARVPDGEGVYVMAAALLPGTGSPGTGSSDTGAPPHLVVAGSLITRGGQSAGRDVVARVGWNEQRPYEWLADIPPMPEGGQGIRELASHTPLFAVLGTRDGAPVVAAVLPDARLLVFDADGTLRQCSSLAPLGPGDWVRFEGGIEPPTKLLSLRAGRLGDGRVLLVTLVSRTLVYDVLGLD